MPNCYMWLMSRNFCPILNSAREKDLSRSRIQEKSNSQVTTNSALDIYRKMLKRFSRQLSPVLIRERDNYIARSRIKKIFVFTD